jgi:hypothetical protein
MPTKGRRPVDDTPFEFLMRYEVAEAQLLRPSLSVDEACDYVIQDWLEKGRAEALVFFFVHGHVPGKELLKRIGQMLMVGENMRLPAEAREGLPHFDFTLAIKRQGGRQPHPLTARRHKQIARAVEARVSAGMTVEDAVKTCTDQLVKGGEKIGTETVWKAFYKWRSLAETVNLEARKAKGGK